MADFKPINTQEEFDAAIQARLERERLKVRGEYSDYDTLKDELAQARTDLEAERGKTTDFEAKITELTGKVQRYETDSVKTRIAAKYGLAPELSGRLNGTTEEEIDADAQALTKIVGARVLAPPYTPGNNEEEDGKGYRGFARKLFGRTEE